jgi:undecaprenyl-phosphate 4-deoxy-4-formamido-L-arabinose transferase
MPNPLMAPRRLHRVSVVIPVFQGEMTLGSLIDEILPLTNPSTTTDEFQIVEVLLVNDRGPDRSDEVIRQLASAHDFIRPLWLSRNFGQHPATLAGMASSSGDWIVTMDEDGQHEPSAIGDLLDTALNRGSQLVYAKPVNPPPHGVVRNVSSRLAKWVFAKFLSREHQANFQSYRLILGEIGRSVAAYSGTGVFLDVALGWVAGPAATCPVRLRLESDRPSGYSSQRLLGHFWRLVVSNGTRPLRLVSALGALFSFCGLGFAIYLVAIHFGNGSTPQGWVSTMIVILVSTGAILFCLGVIAEYLGVAVSMAMGKPLYLIVSDPKDGPLGESAPDQP